MAVIFRWQQIDVRVQLLQTVMLLLCLQKSGVFSVGPKHDSIYMCCVYTQFHC